MNIFITSDTHFCHDKDFIYKPRGFSSIEEMNEEIVKRWNSVVKPDDLVYHLGDVMLMDNEKGLEYLKRLNGQIYIIRGNHDTNNRINVYQECGNVFECGDWARVITYKKWNFYLSHFPTIVGNYDDDSRKKNGFYCLCGHRHATNRWVDFKDSRAYHVEMDAHNCYPVLIDDVIEDIKGVM